MHTEYQIGAGPILENHADVLHCSVLLSACLWVGCQHWEKWRIAACVLLPTLKLSTQLK